MSKTQPLVTIAIPTYNRAGYLRDAIESALKQSYQNFEIIVSDNCSMDNTEKVIASFAYPMIKYFRHDTNRGMVANWNFCLEQANGEFFLLLSDDDILERNAVEWLQRKFNDPSVVLAYGRALYMDQDSRPTTMSLESPSSEPGYEFIVNSLMRRRVVLPSSTLYRTGAARNLGGYPDIGTATDLALRLSIASRGMVRYNPQPLVRYRVHDRCLSRVDEEVVSSHEAFVQWASKSTSPLHEYRELVRRYCTEVIYRTAVSQALRGRRDPSLAAMATLRRLGSSWKHEVFFRIAGLPPVQLLGAVRRHIWSCLRTMAMPARHCLARADIRAKDGLSRCPSNYTEY